MVILDRLNESKNATVSDIGRLGSYDVVVVGGGIAGVGAALAAAKRGCKTIIIEALSSMGGLATAGLINIPLNTISGLGEEMIDELEEEGGYWHRNTDPEIHKRVIDSMLKKYNCDILLATPVVEAVTENDVIKGVVVATKTGLSLIEGKIIIDCSGDSDASYYAGAETLTGREEDGMSQAASLVFSMGGVDWDKYVHSDQKLNDPWWKIPLKQALENGDIPYEIENHLDWMTHFPNRPQHCGMDEVSICIAHSRNAYPTDNKDLSRMYIEGREQAKIISEFVKKYIPGFENSFLVSTAQLEGVRESRRTVGQYVLQAADLAGMKKYDDVIATSNQGFDMHGFSGPGCQEWAYVDIDGKKECVVCNAGGFKMSTYNLPEGAVLKNYKGQTSENAEFKSDDFYDIPYRCLVAKDIKNLCMAGRNLSADFPAQSGARLIMTCFSMGEAAGTAAAIALYNNIYPAEVDYKELQRALVSTGVDIGQTRRKIDSVADMKDFEDVYYLNGVDKNMYAKKKNAKKVTLRRYEITTACVHCFTCVTACRFGAIEMRQDKAYIHQDKCKGCGNCYRNCVAEAIVIKE